MAALQEYLALDLGATSGRACLGGFDGDRLCIREIHRFPNGPVEFQSSLRWDFPRLLAGIEAALQKAADESKRVVSVGCDTWGLDTGFLDASGALMELPFSYQDSRTANVLSRMESILPVEDLFTRTAAPCVAISTLGQLLATKDRTPELLKQAKTLLFMPDLIHQHLTGEAVSEFCIASTSQLTSWRSRDWDWELIGQFGFPRGLFPPIRPTGSRVGKLRNQLVNHLGIPSWDVYQPAGHDTALAVAAAPIASSSDLVISSGTWSMLGILVDEPVISPEAVRMVCGTYGIPGPGWCFMQGVMGLWLLERFRHEEKAGPVEELIEKATRTTKSCCLFNPRDPVFTQSKSFTEGLTQWCKTTGQALPTSMGEWVRCILESLALFCDQAIRNLARLARRKIEQVVIVGGGSRNQLLNQLTANATGLPVVVGPAEATVIGNILVQMVGRGELGSFSEIRSVVSNSWPVQVYEPQEQEIWNEKRERLTLPPTPDLPRQWEGRQTH